MHLNTLFLVILTIHAVSTNPVHRTMKKRGTAFPTSVNCGGRWGFVWFPDADSTIVDWLISSFNTGSGEDSPICCAAKSCCSLVDEELCDDFGAKIGMCNGNDYGKCVNMIDLAWRLQETTAECMNPPYNSPHVNVAGQSFYPDGTQAIVQQCPEYD